MTEKYTETRTFDSDTALTILGVPGRLKRRTVCYQTKIGCWEHQNWVSERRTQEVDGEKLVMEVNIRFDDNCHNGHNDFAITASGWYDHWKSRDIDFGGCCHDTIEKMFPELAGLIKWHLVSTESPMHYVANTVYHASNLEGGKAKGEPNRWQRRVKFGTFPITFTVKDKFLAWLEAALAHRNTTAKTNPHRKNFQVVEVPYVKTKAGDYDFSPKYSFDDYTTAWHECPFETQAEALEWQTALITCGMEIVTHVTGYSKGKERNLEYARSSANWPEATDEQLCLPAAELTQLLEARLPAMMAEFRQTMDSIGMFWSPEDFK